MSEKTPAEADECQHHSYHHPKWNDAGCCYWDGIITQPKADIIDKEKLASQKNWEEYSLLIRNKVRRFIYKLGIANYHPTTYVFYGRTEPSDGSVKWRITSITSPQNMHNSDKKILNNYCEVPLPFNRSHFYVLKSSKSSGDGTVPVESFKALQRQNGQVIKSALATNIDHQEAYEVKDLVDIHQRPALQFTLRGIVKMVQGIPVSR